MKCFFLRRTSAQQPRSRLGIFIVWLSARTAPWWDGDIMIVCVTADLALDTGTGAVPVFEPCVGGAFAPSLEASLVAAVRDGFALLLTDLLARRSRLMLLDVRAAMTAAPAIAALLARERGKTARWADEQVAALRRERFFFGGEAT